MEAKPFVPDYNELIPGMRNFRWGEVLRSNETAERLGLDVYYATIYEYQVPLILEATFRVQMIRDYFKVPIFVRSGVRDKNIYDTLIANGHAVSKYRIIYDVDGKFKIKGTDHSYMNPEVNPVGVGAIDFQVENRNLLVDIYSYVKDKMRHLVGQCILYRKYKKPWFIHISIPKWFVFSDVFISSVIGDHIYSNSYRFFINDFPKEGG